MPAFTGDEKEWAFTSADLYAPGKYYLKGQHAIVTGANSGTGYESALALARLGASVTMACRNPQRCETAANRIRFDTMYLDLQGSGGTVSTMILDTSSLASVQAFAQAFHNNHSKLDMLFLNAGIGLENFKGDENVSLSIDGIELVFATNHVGHFLLYRLLEPLLLESTFARVVLTSSAGSFRSYPYKVATDLETLNNIKVSSPGEKRLVYGQSKLAQVFFAQEATRRLLEANNNNIYVNAAHPGVVDTALFDKNRHVVPTFLHGLLDYVRQNIMWTGAEGALTLLYLGVGTDELKAKNIRGKYYHPQSIPVSHPLTQGGESLQKKLWEFSDDLVKDYMLIEQEAVLVEEEEPAPLAPQPDLEVEEAVQAEPVRAEEEPAPEPDDEGLQEAAYHDPQEEL